MNQETLFELQDCVAELALRIAKKENKTKELIADFPFLYESNTAGGEDEGR